MEPLIHAINFSNPCQGQANGYAGFYFTQMVSMVLASHCTLGNPGDYPGDFGTRLTNNDEFDFIIVGGGSAGSVIASRLTEISNWKVLLVEAGGNPTFESDIPGFSLSLPGSEMDWNFKVNPTTGKSCRGMEKETCVISQGKVLGGTSTINEMHYLRGSPSDYDEWKNLGNRGWGYENVLEYFKKSEKLEDDITRVSGDLEKLFAESKKKYKNDEWELHRSSKMAAEEFHSRNGVMGVNHFAYDATTAPLKKALCQAAEELGVPHITDINAKGREIGCVEAMAVLHEASRGNAAKSFLSNAKNRPNLHVAKNAVVTKLMLEKNVVKGVKVMLRNKTMSVYARNEVILSAGAINSPRLLLLSGIGGRQHLKSVGVDVVKDLPGVGENLQMHVSFFGLAISVDKHRSKVLSEWHKINAMYHFISGGNGMFGNVGVNDVVTFASTTNATVPDVQFVHHLNRIRDYYTFNELLVSLGVKNEIRNGFSRAFAKSNVLLICPKLLRPNARGKVEITSPRFDAAPRISNDFLSSADDVATLIRGIKMAVRLTETESFKEFDPEVLRIDVDECKSFEFKSDDYWKCLLRYLATPTNELAGTCKMGPDEDAWAVVDDELKVRGIERLRVADSSIMPVIVGGSTSIAAVMIGERAFDLIKKDWTEAAVNDEL